MVNIRSYGVGAFCLGIGLLVGPEAQAGLPTFDAANISGTISIVKNGAKNLQGIGEVTGKVGELNTIVGDAAASLSKLQSEYGDKINEGIEMGKKAMARKAEAEAALSEHKAAIQEQKDMYQAAIDSVSQKREDASDTQMQPDELQQAQDAQYSAMQAAQPAELQRPSMEDTDAPLMTSADRVYVDSVEEDGTSEGENFVDGMPADMTEIPSMDTQPAEKSVEGNVVKVDGGESAAQPAVMKPMVGGADVEDAKDAAEGKTPAVQQGIMKPVSGAAAAALPATGVIQNTSNSERKVFRKAVQLPGRVSGSAQVAPAASVAPVSAQPVPAAKAETLARPALQVQKPASAAKALAPAKMEVERPAEAKATSPVQRRQFRTAPRLNRVERVSSNTYRQSSKMAFASAGESEGVGNSYIGNVYVVPLAGRCEISAEKFINDETARKNCMERVIRENNADNSFDSALSMKDCRKMIYDAIVALLAEATNSKYEAANYSKTLDKQDELAGDSTDVRGDLTVIAMSNQQTQLLLNRLSMSYSSLIILETVEQLCSAKKDVLGDSDLDEDKK